MAMLCEARPGQARASQGRPGQATTELTIGDRSVADHSHDSNGAPFFQPPTRMTSTSFESALVLASDQSRVGPYFQLRREQMGYMARAEGGLFIIRCLENVERRA